MNQPLAYIHPDAKIGQNVVIEPFAYIGGEVEIGDGCWIGQHAIIKNSVKIGKNSKIFPGAVIGEVPQDLKFSGEKTYIEIGENTVIRECVTINLATKDVGVTKVGSNCLLMAYVHIAHDCTVGNNCILVNYTGVSGVCTIGDWAIIGGGTLIHQFVHIGAHSMIGGGSLVRKDVPPYVKAGQDPLCYVGINAIGLRRRQFTPEQIQHVHDVYRILYQQGKSVANAIQLIESDLPASPERTEILEFIRNSKRGIMKGFTSIKRNKEEVEL